uniref:Uncharacterized protein n=1 Tax=Trichogramma kaykai TaxID=54128 RepID=A0ABD2WQV3_9HYME
MRVYFPRFTCGFFAHFSKYKIVIQLSVINSRINMGKEKRGGALQGKGGKIIEASIPRQYPKFENKPLAAALPRLFISSVHYRKFGSSHTAPASKTRL